MEKIFQEILILKTATGNVHSDAEFASYESGYDAYRQIPNPHERLTNPTSDPIKSYPDVYHAMSDGWFLMTPPIIDHDTQICYWWLTRTIKIERS